jgi:reactive chlorine resistance protein C
MLRTKFLSPRAATGSIRISRAKSLIPPAVTAETAEHVLANAGQFLARYGLVLVLAWIGVGHNAHPATIQPLIAHSPLLSWLYGIFNLHTLGYALGSAEILAAVLIALRLLWPRVSAVGSVFAVLVFCSTISFLFTTPGVTTGGPVLSMLGEFLIKDVVLLGVSLWTLADSLGAYRRTRSASPGHSATAVRS